MRKLVTVGLLASFAAAGCADQNAVQSAANRAALTQRISEFKAAQNEFIPVGEGKGESELDRKTNVTAYHRDRTAKAAAALKELVEKGLDPVQKVAALRLIAQTQIGDALVTARDADLASSKYQAQSSSLLGYVHSIQQDVALVSSPDADSSKLIDAVKADRDSTQKNLDTLKADASKLSGDSIDPAKAEIDKLKSDSEAGRAKAGEIREGAFAKDGQAQFDDYKLATDTERAAQKASAEAQTKSVTLEVNQSKLKLLNLSIQQQQSMLDSQNQQLDSLQKRQAAMEDFRTKARTEAKDVSDQMNAQIKAIYDGYNADVDSRYDLAQKSADDAIGCLKDAVKAATGNEKERKAAQTDLLSAETAKAYILAQRIAAATSYGKVLSLIADSGTKYQLPIGEYATQTGNTEKENARKFVAEATTVVDDGLKDATDLTANGGDDNSKALYDALNTYKTRLGDYATAPVETPK